MRVFRNASIDRLMARRAEKNSKSSFTSGLFDNYLTGFLNNQNYGAFGSLGGFGSIGNSSDITSTNPFEVFNTSSTQLNLYKLKQQLQNDRIEKSLTSGEPLRGVSYSEFMMYCLEKNGSVDTNTQQLYKQALKGDEAALRDKQWHTDPDYIIPERLYNNKLITADRDAALEKQAKNEKLEDWEQRLLDTVTGKTEQSK